MRLIVIGQKLFGAEVLRMCVESGHRVAAAFSPPTARDVSRPDRLRAAAEECDVSWRHEDSLRESDARGVDLIVTAHSHRFIGTRTRLAARLGAIGYHPSLLPRHRGRDAVRWTIHCRDAVAGGSVYWLSDAVDGGDIAAQRHVMVRPDDTAETLWRRELFPLGVELLRGVLDDLSNGVMTRVPQETELATWEPAFGVPPLHRPELPLLGIVAGFDVRNRL